MDGFHASVTVSWVRFVACRFGVVGGVFSPVGGGGSFAGVLGSEGANGPTLRAARGRGAGSESSRIYGGRSVV